MKIVLDDGAFAPVRGHGADAGLDLKTREDVTIPAGGSASFDTGVHFEIPVGSFGKIESKSGLNVNGSVVSCGGVIDAGYTGSVVVKLYNLGNEPHEFKRGDKIAQIVFQPCYYPVLEIADTLEDTERGSDGFGSTGK